LQALQRLGACITAEPMDARSGYDEGCFWPGAVVRQDGIALTDGCKYWKWPPADIARHGHIRCRQGNILRRSSFEHACVLMIPLIWPSRLFSRA
jgi:hypothetical protein